MSARRRTRPGVHVEIGFSKHPKVLEAAQCFGGPFREALRAVRDYWRYQAEAARANDGRISIAMSRDWDAGSGDEAERAAAALVSAGLWDRADDGSFRFHDWFQYYRPQRAVEERRHAHAEAMAKLRATQKRKQLADRLYAKRYRDKKKRQIVSQIVRSDETPDDPQKSDLTPKHEAQKSPMYPGLKGVLSGEVGVIFTSATCDVSPPPKKHLTVKKIVRPISPNVRSDGARQENRNRPSLLAQTAINGHAPVCAPCDASQNSDAEICDPFPPDLDLTKRSGQTEDPDFSGTAAQSEKNLRARELATGTQIASPREELRAVRAPSDTQGLAKKFGKQLTIEADALVRVPAFGSGPYDTSETREALKTLAAKLQRTPEYAGLAPMTVVTLTDTAFNHAVQNRRRREPGWTPHAAYVPTALDRRRRR